MTLLKSFTVYNILLIIILLIIIFLLNKEQFRFVANPFNIESLHYINNIKNFIITQPIKTIVTKLLKK